MVMAMRHAGAMGADRRGWNLLSVSSPQYPLLAGTTPISRPEITQKRSTLARMDQKSPANSSAQWISVYGGLFLRSMLGVDSVCAKQSHPLKGIERRCQCSPFSNGNSPACVRRPLIVSVWRSVPLTVHPSIWVTFTSLISGTFRLFFSFFLSI
jgi:hypothetical protein